MEQKKKKASIWDKSPEEIARMMDEAIDKVKDEDDFTETEEMDYNASHGYMDND